MGILIQIAALTEFLTPDFVWLGILTPLFFMVIRIAEAEGLIAPWGSIHAVELSVLLAYLTSAAVTLLDARAVALSREPVRSRKCGTRFSERQVQHAVE